MVEKEILRNAFYWFSKSANQEDADAQFFLALAIRMERELKNQKKRLSFV